MARTARSVSVLIPAVLSIAILHGQTASVARRTASSARTVTLHVDAREFPRKILHAELVIPASPGPMTLVYPKWLPGEHGPTGPITDVAGLKVSTGGRAVAWHRDAVDMYAFHIVVPPGASDVTIKLDFLMATGLSGFSSAASASAHLGILAWNEVLVYPQGVSTDAVSFKASVQLPAGWKFATALRRTGESGGWIDFAPVSLTTLVDSPLVAGEFFRTVPLDSGAIPIELDIAADSAAALEMKPEFTASMKQLVAEADALFGARHFDRYHFLFTLSDYVAHFGLEHHQSNDTRMPERSLLDPALGNLGLWVLSHEFMHSWNGKYRRPSGLATPNYQEPMKGDLLWVYEGLTQYLGMLLSARSGLWTAKQYEERLAAVAATLDRRAGRSWRPLSDTAVAAQLLYSAPPQWSSYRRSVDFYDEGWLIWLEADTLIREQTGLRSLDDFCRRFHGGQTGPPALKTYTFDDVVASLNEVAAYDWRAFFEKRLSSTDPHAPLRGIEQGGWRLVYNDEANQFLRDAEQAMKVIDLTSSIGLRIRADGGIEDAVPGSPAYEAGVGPGMTVLAVNGRKWSPEIIHDVLHASGSNSGSISFLVEDPPDTKTVTVNYHDGAREPHLVRNESKPDLLSQIIAPRAAK